MRPSTGETSGRHGAADGTPRFGAIDEVVLRGHRLLDRLARWAWLGADSEGPRRRFLIVQIDGLSRAVLDQALATGQAPNMARLLRRRRLERRDMSVGIPSSTPAFQAAAMYGVHPDIPGFHFYDKRDGLELHFPRPGVADLIEQRVSEGHRGILEGGACYGCVFTGGAHESLMTFARLMKPTRAGMRVLRLPLQVLVVGWAIAKCLWLTGIELVRFVGRGATAGQGWRPWRWRLLGLKIFFSIWVREYFTLGASGDIYRGVPSIYVNYLDYDVFAHSFGPSHRSALRALRRVDSSIGRLVRILERVPELEYDLYVLSDHGQTPSRPFPQVAGGRSIDDVVRVILEETAAPEAHGETETLPDAPLRRGQSALGNATGMWQRFLNHFERALPAGHRARHDSAASVLVIAAGPNAFVYFTASREPLPFEELERRYPGAAARLSSHDGIGLVLARARDGGAVCWWRGRQVPLDGPSAAGPFADRPDQDVVLADLRALMAMPSAGDLVLYGTGAPAGDVSFIDERGAHAGPTEREMLTFLLHPPSVELPREPLTHPIQLYPHFVAYAGPAAVSEAERVSPPPATRSVA